MKIKKEWVRKKQNRNQVEKAKRKSKESPERKIQNLLKKLLNVLIVMRTTETTVTTRTARTTTTTLPTLPTPPTQTTTTTRITIIMMEVEEEAITAIATTEEKPKNLIQEKRLMKKMEERQLSGREGENQQKVDDYKAINCCDSHLFHKSSLIEFQIVY